MKRFFSILFIALSTQSLHAQGFKDLGKKKYTNVHALIVGVANYEEAPKLNYADKDARVVYQMLANTFPEHKANIDTLINEKASQLNIVNGIRDLVLSASENDLVIFYFSGHGDVVEDIIDGEKGYFLAQDASKSRVYYPAGGAVEFSYVNRALTKITDNKAEVWMITDACRSGKVINEKGASVTMTSLNEGFKNTTKFISCAAHELSYEDETLEQGVFTYYLVRALSGEADSEDAPGLLNVDEINSFMKSSVRKYTESKQTPKIIASNEFENIISTNPEFSNLIKSINEGSQLDLLASVGNKGNGSEKSDPLIKFETLIAEGKLHSKTGFAFESLKGNTLNASQEDLTLMKSLLTEALLERGQRNTNMFLSGRPMIGKNENYITSAKDFALAGELLGQDHPMYEQVIARAEFFSAMSLVKAGKDLLKAELELNRLAKAYPRAAHINQGLALLYMKQSNKEKAEEQLGLASTKVETWSKPVNSSAYLNIIGGKLKEADELIKESSNLDNNQDNVHLLEGYLYSANFELQNAAKALDKIKNSEGLISQGEILEMEGRINELRGRVKVAEELYSKSLTEEKDNEDLLMRLGNLYKHDGDTLSALKYFRRVKRLNKDNQSALANIALLTNKDVVLSIESVEVSNVQDVLMAANVFEDKKQYSKAIELLNKSIVAINWNPELYYQLGKMQYLNGEKNTSMASVKKAIEISPYHFKSIRSLSYMYLHEKKYNEAQALIKKHDPYFKESAKYLALSYQVYNQSGSKSDLYPLLERAIQLDSLETDAYKALYSLHIENNAYDEALREFKNLITIGGGTKDSVDFYNKVESQVKFSLDQGYYMGQKEGLKIILDLDPYDFEMSYYMGLVLYMEQDYEGAKTSLRAFSKSIQSFTPSVQRTYYNLKAKISLEIGHPDLSERLFGMGTASLSTPDYLGLAMAQFEQGKQSWLSNFRKAGEPIDYNEDAIKRYEKMRKKAAKSGGGYGGVERNRR